MPDIWTPAPATLRSILTEAGIECGAEARIYKGRDPYWTCRLDSEMWMADVYVHKLPMYCLGGSAIAFCSLLFVLALALGYVTGKRAKGTDE